MHPQIIDFTNTRLLFTNLGLASTQTVPKFEMIQHLVARFVLNKPWSKHYRDSISEMLHKLNWPSLQTKRKQVRLILLFKMLNKLYSRPISSIACHQLQISPRAPSLLTAATLQIYISNITIHFYPEQFLIGTIYILKNQQAGPHSIQKLFNETFELIIHNYISVLALVGFAN